MLASVRVVYVERRAGEACMEYVNRNSLLTGSVGDSKDIKGSQTRPYPVRRLTGVS